MDEFSRLENKLAKLRQGNASPGAPRVLKGDAGKLLLAIMTEIDETILSRRVSFAVDGGETVHLAVANRRLQLLVAPAPNVAGANDVAGIELKAPEDDAVAGIKDVLTKVLEGHETVTVTTARFQDLSPPSDVGIPVDMLGKAWGLEASVAVAGDPLQALGSFLEGLGDTATGWLRIEGEEVAAQGGTDDAVAALGESAALFLDGYFTIREDFTEGETGPVSFLFATADGTAVIFIDAGEVMAFISAEGANALQIAQDWQQTATG